MAAEALSAGRSRGRGSERNARATPYRFAASASEQRVRRGHGVGAVPELREFARLDTHFRSGYCTSLAQKRPLLT
jgi:hypothetical protein